MLSPLPHPSKLLLGRRRQASGFVVGNFVSKSVAVEQWHTMYCLLTMHHINLEGGHEGDRLNR